MNFMVRCWTQSLPASHEHPLFWEATSREPPGILMLCNPQARHILFLNSRKGNTLGCT